MNSNTAQPFALSLVLHLGCGVALVAALSQPLREMVTPIRPETFSVVPFEPTTSITSTAPVTDPLVRFPSLPSLPKFISQPVSNTPDAETQTTHPAIPVQSTQTAPQHTSFEQFVRSHPQAGAHPATPTPNRNPNVLKINPKDFTYHTGDNVTPTASSRGETDADAEFVARLKAEIRHSYADKNGALTGLTARVEFTLTGDGSLKNARVLESSGSAEFDQSVLSTFQRIRTSGFLPSSVGKTFRLRFQVADGS